MHASLLLLILTILVFKNQAFAQSANQSLRRGNNSYNENRFQDAENYYRRGLEKSPLDSRALFNLSNTLYRQGRYEEAANLLEGLAGMKKDNEKRADILHNLGNARIAGQKIEEAINAYKESLRLSPNDAETRHNLAYALRLLQQQRQQQQQQQQQNNQDQGNNNKSPEETTRDANRQPKQGMLTRQDAERMLNALNKREQNVQKKIDRNNNRIESSEILKDW